MNKRILNKDLSKELVHRVNGAPDHLFANFLDLFCGVGVHQVAFLSSSLERTDVARALDPTPFLSAETLHNYLIAYIAKHRYAPCYYSSANYLGHRVENADLHDYAGLTYEDIGVRFPIILMQFAKVLDLPADVFEQINGTRYINDFAPPEITYVDNMLEYMVRAISKGRPINILNKFPMEQILARCRAHRLDQFADIWTLSEEFRQMQWRLDDAEAAAAALYANLNARRNGLYDLAMTFTDKKL